MDERHELINLINKLQSYRSTGCKIDIQLPQIVVVGAQSSGKSSVLDGLIGDSILPRGAGTVTKCPIIVQLFCTLNPEEAGIEIQDAPDIGRTKESDIIRKWIGEEMESGDGGIKDKPIVVRVYSPDVVTLTVVDLPGIKKVASNGERDDIGKLIEDMSRKYINEKNAIILAVSPANYDICNSDGIILAKEADPAGDRTIGVLTKLDLMDEGTDARKLLTGTSTDVNVKLGMIGLVNRSQKDIDNNVSVQDQLSKEKAYLHQTYPDIACSNGVPFLRVRLHELLVRHINKCLPGILAEMEILLKKCIAKIADIPQVATSQDKYRYASRIIKSFENTMKRELEGSTRSPDYGYVYGGIKIKDIFESQFAREMDTAASLTKSRTSNEEIVTAFRNSGSFDTFFVYPEAVFKKLAQDQVREIEAPALKCARKVHEEIVKMADRFLQERKDSFAMFPEFRKSIREVVLGMLSKKLNEVNKHVQDYIRVQASMVFSLNKAFTDELSQIRRKLEKNLHGHDVDREDGELPSSTNGIRQVKFAMRQLAPIRHDSKALLIRLQNQDTIDLIRDMVNLYFQHTKLQIQDYIPKLVTDQLIKQFSTEDSNGVECDSLGEELRVHVMDKFNELVNLPSTISDQREQNVKLHDVLNDAIDEIKALLSLQENGEHHSDSDIDP